LIWICVTA